jgi:hypothetical protein
MSLTSLDIRIPLDMNLEKITNLANGTTLEDAATFDQIDSLQIDVSNLETLTGVAGAVNLGTFAGTTITDNTDIKTALQELETAVESGGTTYTAGSGLTLAATTFKLGGTLSENTTINGASVYNYTLTGISDYVLSAASISVNDSSNTSRWTSDRFEFTGTGALKLHIGTTAQRPTPSNGKLRYNSTIFRMEYYTSSAWEAVAHQSEAVNFSGYSSLNSSTIASTDELMVNDSGTVKKIQIEELREYLYRSVDVASYSSSTLTLNSTNLDTYAGKFISWSGTGTATLTLNSTIPTGTQYVVANNRTGLLSITTVGGTIRSLDSLTDVTLGGGLVTITCVGSNVFHVAGNLE